LDYLRGDSGDGSGNLETTISTLITSITDALILIASTSSHTVSRAVVRSDGLAESDRIRAVKESIGASNRDLASLSAIVLGGSPHDVDNSVKSSSGASSVQAVRIRGHGFGRIAGQVTSEALTVQTSSVDLLAGEGRVVDTLGVFAVELELGSDDSADLDQRVTDAVSTTVTDFSAANVSSSAVFIGVFGGIDAFRVEIATSSFTKVIRFSVVIVNREPASTFEETEGEFRDSGSDSASGGHEIPLEESSGNVSTSVVFHDKTGDSAAAIVRSESLSQRREIEDSSGVTIDGSSLDVAIENAAVGINEIVVKRTVHT